MSVIVIAVVMALIVVVAALVVAYAAGPNRGREVPGAPWLGTALERAVEASGIDPDPELEADDAVHSSYQPAQQSAHRKG